MSRALLSLFVFPLTGFLMTSPTAPAAEPTAGEHLHAIFDAEWERTLRENPTWASSLGDLRYNDRWPDLSLKAIVQRNVQRAEVLLRLEAFGPETLSHADKLNRKLFQKEYETDLEGHQYHWYLLALNQRDGIQDESALADSLRFETIRDYEDWIARMRAFPQYMDQTIALLAEGAKARIVHPKVVMHRVPAQIKKQIVDDPEQSLFFKPFRNVSKEISAADRERLVAEAKQAVAEHVVPSYRRLLAFFEDEYLPACFDNVGVWQMPQGAERYAFSARKFTTTELTPQEIHDIGQSEVRRIRGEMEKIIEQVGFQGTFREFLDDLRTNPKFYYEDPNDLLRAYRAVSKEIDPQLPKLFGRLPRIPYGVEAIPMNLAPDTTTAYYRPPSADGRRAGTYFVNLFKPEARPKYEIEALSLHESVPGHHLQIALAMELESFPEFRRYGGYTAFVEGWGLYAESLGGELGLYQDPYSKFGQLTYEMWRAVRLVVDTGMHSMHWTRQQSIDFFAANTAKTLLDIENEVDRYISWPGQALAYKIGELKIRELRTRAERDLGHRFDIRDFHDMLLADGAVPLDVLEVKVNAWIESQSTERNVGEAEPQSGDPR